MAGPEEEPEAPVALRAERDALRAQVDVLLASRSWRVTAPLRAARRAAGRLIAALRGTPAAAPAVLQPIDRLAAPSTTAEDVAATAARLAGLEQRLALTETLLETERRRVDHALGAIEGAGDWIAPFHAARTTAAYQAAFERHDPLVSVCIPTMNRAGLLLERAIPSVQAQTHRRLQIIVVGDHTGDDTGARLAALGDERIRFVNLPERGPYPREGQERWLVAGSMPTNRALSLCEGDFVTHLDDDDAMEPTRIAELLEAARGHRADFLWHSFWGEQPEGTWQCVGNGRLETGQVTTGAIFYHRYLATIPWDVHAYRVGEPADWSRMRRIRMMRPRLHFLDRPLLWHHAEKQQPPLVPQPGERFLE